MNTNIERRLSALEKKLDLQSESISETIKKTTIAHVEKHVNSRTKEIADGLAAAREGKASLEMAEKKTTEVLDGAKEKSSEIVSQAEKRASEIIEEAKQNAKTDADRIIANAKSEIDQEVNKAKEELRAQVASLAIEGAQKILEKEIDVKAHSAMLTKLSKEL